jgi:hypothetical protein
MAGNSACPGIMGSPQWVSWAPWAWYFGLTLCPHTSTAVHFACSNSINAQSHPHPPNAANILLPNEQLPYLKFSKVSSCVISLNSSSLKEANTLRSFTRISTALALSCLKNQTIKSTKIDSDSDQGPRAALKWAAPIKSLKVLLLADLKEDLHGVPVVLHLGEAAEVLLDLVPLAARHKVLEVLHVEVEPRLLLQPAWHTGVTSEITPGLQKKPRFDHGGHSLVHRLLELFLIEELQDEEHQLPAQRRHGSPDSCLSLQLSRPITSSLPGRSLPNPHKKAAWHRRQAENPGTRAQSPNLQQQPAHDRDLGRIPAARPSICSCRRRRTESGRLPTPQETPSSATPPPARVWPSRRRLLLHLASSFPSFIPPLPTLSFRKLLSLDFFLAAFGFRVL